MLASWIVAGGGALGQLPPKQNDLPLSSGRSYSGKRNLFIARIKRSVDVPRPLIFQLSPSGELPELAPSFAPGPPALPDEKRPRALKVAEASTGRSLCLSG
jgi:hypothetical protein